VEDVTPAELESAVTYMLEKAKPRSLPHAEALG
jgi:hypothetical protein